MHFLIPKNSECLLSFYSIFQIYEGIKRDIQNPHYKIFNLSSKWNKYSNLALSHVQIYVLEFMQIVHIPLHMQH